MLRVEPEILANYVDDGHVQLVFWHMLDHRQSLLAHHAVECAGRQSPLDFWRMHDELFSRQGELWGATVETMGGFASDIGLDSTAFQSCMADQTVAAKVTAMDQQRRNAGIRLRPSFDLNGEIIQGGIPYDLFAQRIDNLLGR